MITLLYNKFMDFIFAKTADDLKLPGFYYAADNKEVCVLFVHGMSGSILENYFGDVLGRKLQQAGIGYIFTHNRGYGLINDIETTHPDTFTGLASVNVPIFCIMGEHDDVIVRTAEDHIVID